MAHHCHNVDIFAGLCPELALQIPVQFIQFHRFRSSCGIFSDTPFGLFIQFPDSFRVFVPFWVYSVIFAAPLTLTALISQSIVSSLNLLLDFFVHWEPLPCLFCSLSHNPYCTIATDYGTLHPCRLPHGCKARCRNLFVSTSSGSCYRSAFSKMGVAIKNTLTLGAISLVCIVLISVLIAYVSVRRSNAISGGLDIATMFLYIVPDSILGIALITAFNTKPFQFAGTAFILIVAFTIKRMPYTVCSSAAILRSIGNSTEKAALSMGASNMQTFFRVTLPVIMRFFRSHHELDHDYRRAELVDPSLHQSGKNDDDCYLHRGRSL